MARKKSSDAVARTKVNQVVTKVSTFAALDERGAASFKKALTAKAEELGKTVAIYASYFWAVIQAKGGLVKENLAKILSGDVFAFAGGTIRLSNTLTISTDPIWGRSLN